MWAARSRYSSSGKPDCGFSRSETSGEASARGSSPSSERPSSSTGFCTGERRFPFSIRPRTWRRLRSSPCAGAVRFSSPFRVGSVTRSLSSRGAPTRSRNHFSRATTSTASCTDGPGGSSAARRVRQAPSLPSGFAREISRKSRSSIRFRSRLQSSTRSRRPDLRSRWMCGTRADVPFRWDWGCTPISVFRSTPPRRARRAASGSPRGRAGSSSS